MTDYKGMLESGKQGEILQSADKLRKQIISKLKEKEGSECEELALLWELIGSKQITCARTCSYLLVNLVEQGLVQPLPALTQLLAKLSLGYNYSGIIPAVSQILALVVKSNVISSGSFTCPYSINANQHPFISILRSTPKSWDLILDEFFYILNHESEEIQSHALTLLKPVYLYLFCDPNYHLHFSALRSILFQDLLQRSKESEAFLKLGCDIVSWMPYSQQDSFRECYQYAILHFKFLLDNDHNNILKERTTLLTSLLKHQVSYGFNYGQSLALLTRCDHVIENWDVHCLIFNHALEIAPIGHQEELLIFCEKLLLENKISKYVAGIMVTSLLQSLSFDSSLTASTQKKADIVRFCLKNEWEEKAVKLETNQFEPNISKSNLIVKVLNEISGSEEKRCNWLKMISKSEGRFLSENLLLVSSIFLFAQKTEEARLSLEILQQMTKESPVSSSMILTLILHKLAGAERKSEPGLYLALLKALPLMAKDKNCVSLILKLVGSLAAKPHLTPLRLRLLTSLWRQEPRCFQFLHKALEETPDQTVFTEVQIARAMIMKDIVSTHAGQYGSDLLPLLSAILNQCSSPLVTMASHLALESIYTLCKESVIDIRTTVKVIAPKCIKDPREKIVQGYCNILSLVPTFRVSGSEYAKFTEECVAWLWKSVVSGAPAIKCSAYKALANYPLEATKLKMLPNFAREGLKLPAAYCATPMDAARKPEDVLPYVPGICWVKLISRSPRNEKQESLSEAKLNLLESLLRSEVKDLPNSVYHPNTTMRTEVEPVNYNHLPDHSILRAVLAFIIEKKELPPGGESEESEARIKAILSLIGKDFGRHLPPLDWLSLESYMARSELRPAFIRIVSVQALHSRSAKIILERQVSGEPDMETSLACLNSLEYIAAAIPTPVLANFTNRCLHLSLKKAVSGTGSSPLNTCFQAIKRSLERHTIPEPNRLALATCLEGLFDNFPEDIEDFQEYLDTLCLLPNKSIERLSSPALWWEATTPKLAKAAHLRAQLALKEDSDSPLIWLNELIEVLSNKNEDNSFMLRHLVTVIQAIRVKSYQNAITWLLELMGQISARLRKPGGEANVLFLLDVFNVSVIMLTESDIYSVQRDQLCVSRSARQHLLPISLHKLCQTSGNLSGQLADWSLRLAKRDNLPGGFSQSLATCLPVFKFADNWKEALMWSRIVVN